VDKIYADFDYPDEMRPFVAFMPPDDGYDPRCHTHEEYKTRLLAKWQEFLTAQRSKFG
jgi:hypothetical protein